MAGETKDAAKTAGKETKNAAGAVGHDTKGAVKTTGKETKKVGSAVAGEVTGNHKDATAKCGDGTYWYWWSGRARARITAASRSG